MPSLPRILDLRDDLDPAAAESDASVAEELADLQADLEALAEPGRTDPASDRRTVTDTETVDAEATDRLDPDDGVRRDPTGRLDVVADSLLRLEERADGAVESHLRSARQRVQQYRDGLVDDAGRLSLVSSRLSETDADAPTDTGDLAGDRGTLAVTLATLPPGGDFELEAAFLAADGSVLDRTRETLHLDGGVETTVDLDVAVPANAASYEIRVRSA